MVKGLHPELCAKQGHRVTGALFAQDAVCNGCGSIIGAGGTWYVCRICEEFHLCRDCESGSFNRFQLIACVVLILSLCLHIWTSQRATK